MGTYRQIFYQIVFSTKNREMSISEEHEEELYKYIWGIINNHKCKLYRINSMPNHIHIFSDLHPSVSLSDYVKAIKGAFTYSIRERDMIIDYVKNQKEHHRQENFYDEYKRLLEEHGIAFDEKYLL